MSTDPRTTRLIQVSIPGRSPKVVGVAPEGQAAAVLVRSSTDVAQAMSTLAAKASEIRAASQLLESERAARLEALKQPAIEAARRHLTTLQAEQQRVEAVRRDSFPVERGDRLSYHAVVRDQLFMQKLAAMPVGERNVLIARAIGDPRPYADLVAAVLRMGPDLLDLPAGRWDELKDSAMQTWRPEEAAHLAALDAQLQLAQRAAEVVEATMREHLPGSVAALRAPLPEPAPATVDYEIPAHIMSDLTNGRITQASTFSFPSAAERQRAAAQGGTQ